MKRIFQIFVLALLSFMLAQPASAWQAGHNVTGGGVANFPGVNANVAENEMVSIAETGVGDLLIFPLYAALDGFSTKISVVNTAPEQSTVAKVVIRKYDDSKEILNFYIYLSPSDMWTGYIYYSPAQNQVRVFSDDDSIMHPTGFQWASPEVPFDQAAFDYDENWMGYVEVYNVATYDIRSDDGRSVAGLDRLGLQNRPADKQDIHDWFWSFRTSQDLMDGTRTVLGVPVPGVEGVQDRRLGANVNVIEPGKNRNILAGWLELNIGNNAPPFDNEAAASAAMRATALQNYQVNVRPLKREDMTMFDSSAYTNMGALDAVLAKSRAIMPYDRSNGSLGMHFFNFPTKYAYSTGNGSPVLRQHQADIGIIYSPYIYDTMEQFLELNISPYPFAFKNELELVTTDFLTDLYSPFMFEEGWIDYNTIAPDRQRFYQTMVALPNFPNNMFAGAPSVGTLVEVQGLPMIPFSLTLDGTSMRLANAAAGDTYSIVYDVLPGKVTPPDTAAGQKYALKDGRLVVVDTDGNTLGSKGSAGPGDFKTFTRR